MNRLARTPRPYIVHTRPPLEVNAPTITQGGRPGLRTPPLARGCACHVVEEGRGWRSISMPPDGGSIRFQRRTHTRAQTHAVTSLALALSLHRGMRGNVRESPESESWEV